MSPTVARRLVIVLLPASAGLFARGFDSYAMKHHLAGTVGGWSTEQRAMLRSLSLSSLEPLAADPSNRYANDSPPRPSVERCSSTLG